MGSGRARAASRRRPSRRPRRAGLLTDGRWARPSGTLSVAACRARGGGPLAGLRPPARRSPAWASCAPARPRSPGSRFGSGPRGRRPRRAAGVGASRGDVRLGRLARSLPARVAAGPIPRAWVTQPRGGPGPPRVHRPARRGAGARPAAPATSASSRPGGCGAGGASSPRRARVDRGVPRPDRGHRGAAGARGPQRGPGRSAATSTG